MVEIAVQADRVPSVMRETHFIKEVGAKLVEAFPGQIERQAGILRVQRNFDAQSLQNLTQYDGENASVLYTTVSVNQAVTDEFPHLREAAQRLQERGLKKHEIRMVIGGFAPDGLGPYVQHNITSNVLWKATTAVAGPIRYQDRRIGENADPYKEETVVSVGDVTGLGGKVSEKFIQDSKEHGFEPRAKLYAGILIEMLKTKTPEELANTTITLHGTSMGAEIALGSLLELLKLDIPVKTLLESPVAIGSLQAGLGYVVEIGLRMLIDPTVKTSMKAQPAFKTRLLGILAQKGIDTGEDPEQKRLKGRLIFQDIQNLVWRKRVLSEDVSKQLADIRTHTVVGKFDPTSTSLDLLRRVPLAEFLKSKDAREFKEEMDIAHKGTDGKKVIPEGWRSILPTFSEGKHAKHTISGSHVLPYDVQDWDRAFAFCNSPVMTAEIKAA